MHCQKTVVLNQESNEVVKKCESCNFLEIHLKKEGTDLTEEE